MPKSAAKLKERGAQGINAAARSGNALTSHNEILTPFFGFGGFYFSKDKRNREAIAQELRKRNNRNCHGSASTGATRP